MPDHAVSEPKMEEEVEGASSWIINVSVDIDLIFLYCQGEI